MKDLIPIPLMIQEHINYLRKFGTERIKLYVKYLLETFKFSSGQEEFIKEFPNYYKTDCPELLIFTKIFTLKNLWYTLYLTCY